MRLEFDPLTFHHGLYSFASFPRKREPKVINSAETAWMPASAGMTMVAFEASQLLKAFNSPSALQPCSPADIPLAVLFAGSIPGTPP